MPKMIELPSGDGWVELATTVNYRQRREVRVALAEWSGDDLERAERAEARVVAALAVRWSREAPLTIEGIEELDARDVDHVFAAASAIFAEATRPFGQSTGATSPPSEPVQP